MDFVHFLSSHMLDPALGGKALYRNTVEQAVHAEAFANGAQQREQGRGGGRQQPEGQRGRDLCAEQRRHGDGHQAQRQPLPKQAGEHGVDRVGAGVEGFQARHGTVSGVWGELAGGVSHGPRLAVGKLRD